MYDLTFDFYDSTGKMQRTEYKHESYDLCMKRIGYYTSTYSNLQITMEEIIE